MRKIKLYGELGSRFGKEFNLVVHTPAEAIRALIFQVKGFKQYLLDSQKNGVYFQVFCRNVQFKSASELNLAMPGEIRIVPTISGSNGEFRTLIGAALIAASTIFGGPGAGAAAAKASNFLMASGSALAIGGAAEVLTRGMIRNPVPPEQAKNSPSYNFSGPVNTMSQGHPVPLGYGEMMIGGAVISAGITTENLMAGYEYKLRDAYKDIWSWETTSGYLQTPPPNYTSTEILEYQEPNPSTAYGWGRYGKWLIRYHYQESYLALREI